MQETDRQRLFDDLLSSEVYARAWRCATRLARTREDAEDLLQDGLTTAFRKLHQLRDRAAFKPWLLAILRRRSVDLAKARAPALGASLWFELSQQDSAAPAEDAPLAAALAALPAGQSQLLALFYLDELTLEEVGRSLRLSTTAVSQRLYRARLALRRRLEEQERIGWTAEGQSNEI